jgi:uncharacterized protein YqeY
MNTIKAVLFIFVGLCLCLFSLGCGARMTPVQIAQASIEKSVAANNAMVAALQHVHDKAVAQRRDVLIQIAKTATSHADGMRQLDAAERGYRKVFDAFQAAELVQHALAEALEAARVAVEAAKSPDLGNLLRLYTELQQAHNAVLTALGGV